MKTHKNMIKAFTVLAIGSLLAACGTGTSKSSSDSASDPSTPGSTQKEPEVNLTPISITAENYTQITSQSLKSLLLNDAGSNALGRSVTVTGNQRGNLASVATGVIIEMLPVNCLNGGTVGFIADVTDADGGQQINLNRKVSVNFKTAFDNCNQAGNLLDGQVSMDMSGNLNELINGASYSLNSNVSSDGLSVTQPGMPTFTLQGEFTYNVNSTDGVTVVTNIISNNSLYIADTSYQMIDFHVQKSVNNTTKAYSYLINSEFSDFYNQDQFVHYQTLEPLVGVGFALPTDGLIAINGANSSILVHAEENAMLRLELDLLNDGVIDDIYYSDWNELVLDSFNNVQF